MLCAQSFQTKAARWFLVSFVCLFVVPAAVVHVTATAAVAADDEEAEEGGSHGGGGMTFMWVVEQSGVIGGFLLLLSIYFIATVVRSFLELREEATAPPEIVTQCNSLLEQRNVQGMFDMLKADDSYFSQTLSAGIAELPHGLDEARDASERQADALTTQMEKNISILAVLGTLGPMIGLLGTLKGMIASFSVIATATDGAPLKPAEVAGGISEALLLTFEGVALSVPAIYFYSFFRNRVAALSVSAQLSADDFLRRINRMMRKSSGSARATAGV
jgi:biopolymer transport protein ExbB